MATRTRELRERSSVKQPLRDDDDEEDELDDEEDQEVGEKEAEPYHSQSKNQAGLEAPTTAATSSNSSRRRPSAAQQQQSLSQQQQTPYLNTSSTAVLLSQPLPLQARTQLPYGAVYDTNAIAAASTSMNQGGSSNGGPPLPTYSSNVKMEQTVGADVVPRPLTEKETRMVNHLGRLQFFLATAPSRWSTASPTPAPTKTLTLESPISSPHPSLNRFLLPNGEHVSCVLWGNLYHITGTDIVRALIFRFEAFARPVKNMKKFEEGVFSDLRNLKPGTDACLEEPKSPFLDLLFKHGCIRTQKKQKVFYWFSVPHDRLFLDALERDLKREKMGQEPTTAVAGEPARSFRYDPKRSLYDQYGGRQGGLEEVVGRVEMEEAASALTNVATFPPTFHRPRTSSVSSLMNTPVLEQQGGPSTAAYPQTATGGQYYGNDAGYQASSDPTALDTPPEPLTAVQSDGQPISAIDPKGNTFLLSLFEGSPSYKQRRKKSGGSTKRRLSGQRAESYDGEDGEEYGRYSVSMTPETDRERSVSVQRRSVSVVAPHPDGGYYSTAPYQQQSAYGQPPGSRGAMMFPQSGDGYQSYGSYDGERATSSSRPAPPPSGIIPPSIGHRIQNPAALPSNLPKTFTCPLLSCGRLFKRLEHLKRHVRTHTMEKPFECPKCEKKFSRSDNLTQHIKTHEKDKGGSSNSNSATAASNNSVASGATVAAPASSTVNSGSAKGLKRERPARRAATTARKKIIDEADDEDEDELEEEEEGEEDELEEEEFDDDGQTEGLVDPAVGDELKAKIAAMEQEEHEQHTHHHHHHQSVPVSTSRYAYGNGSSNGYDYSQAGSPGPSQFQPQPHLQQPYGSPVPGNDSRYNSPHPQVMVQPRAPSPSGSIYADSPYTQHQQSMYDPNRMRMSSLGPGYGGSSGIGSSLSYGIGGVRTSSGGYEFNGGGPQGMYPPSSAYGGTGGGNNGAIRRHRSATPTLSRSGLGGRQSTTPLYGSSSGPRYHPYGNSAPNSNSGVYLPPPALPVSRGMSSRYPPRVPAYGSGSGSYMGSAMIEDHSAEQIYYGQRQPMAPPPPPQRAVSYDHTSSSGFHPLDSQSGPSDSYPVGIYSGHQNLGIINTNIVDPFPIPMPVNFSSSSMSTPSYSAVDTYPSTSSAGAFSAHTAGHLDVAAMADGGVGGLFEPAMTSTVMDSPGGYAEVNHQVGYGPEGLGVGGGY